MKKRSRRGGRRPATEALVFSFLSAADAVEARLEAALDPTGLSLAKLAVLQFLAEAKEALPLSDLAARQHCVRSNITQLVDRLAWSVGAPLPTTAAVSWPSSHRRASRRMPKAYARWPKRSAPS